MTQLTDKVDTLFSTWDTIETPGCVLAVIQDGSISYQKSYGMADLEREVPLSTKSVFDIASVGKQFTAMLIALLAQEGSLSLDDDVRIHIPELPDYNHIITIRNLIHHTSGLLDYTTLMELATMPLENRYFEDALLALITRQKTLNFPPGTKYLYSNSGYFLLGVISQRVKGQSFTSLLRQYILEPLEMNHTDFNDDFRRVVKNRAIGYSPTENKSFNTNLSFCGGYGDGPLLSNIEDLYRWDQNFYANRLGDGSQTLIDQVLTPGKLNNGESTGYGFGLAVSEHRGLYTVRHSGGWAGYVSHIMRFPNQRFTVIVLSNLTSVRPNEIALQVAEIYLADQFTDRGPKERSQPTADAIQLETASIAGVYRSQEQGDVLELTTDLKLILHGMTLQLAALSTTHLILEDKQLTIEVKLHEAGELSLVLHGTPIRCKRMDIQPVGDVQEYVGNYTAASLGVIYHIDVKDEQVFLKRGFAPQETLKLVTKDLFSIDHLLVEFKRGDNNDITSFDLWAGRVEQIQFTRLTDSV